MFIVCSFMRAFMCLLYMINLSQRGEQWGGVESECLRVLFCYFFSWKKGRIRKTFLNCGARVQRFSLWHSLSFFLSLSENNLLCVLYRPTDFVWWSRVVEYLLLLSICFLFGSGEGAFFPYKRRAYVLCVYYHTQKLSSLWISFFFFKFCRSWW